MHQFQEPRFLTAVFVAIVGLGALVAGTAILKSSGKKAAWWLLTVSLTISAGSFVTFLICQELLDQEYASGQYSAARTLDYTMNGSALVAALGVILFVAGFLGLGLRTGRMAKRVAELELLSATLTAETERQRNETSSAG